MWSRWYSISFSFQTCLPDIESDKHSFLLFHHTFLPISMWKLFICHRDNCFLVWHLFSHIPCAKFWLWGHPEVDLLESWHTFQCQHYYALASPTTSGGLGVGGIQSSLRYQVNYVFPPSPLIPLVLSKFLVEHVAVWFRLLILVVLCWMEASWLPTVPNMLADIPWHCPVIQDLVMDVSVGQVHRGLPYLHWTFLAA